MILLTFFLLNTQAADFNSLYDTKGWEDVGISKTKEGAVSVQIKIIGTTPCVQGQIAVAIPAKKIYEVITDIPAAKEFSSENLTASKLLEKTEAHLEYYQHLDTPGWTLSADRFWILRGHDISTENSMGFQWDRFDWKPKYPELAKSIDKKSIEPVDNFGAWIFREKEGKTHATYYICSDPGGSIPYWIKKKAATQTLPGTIADVMREARQRAQ